MRGTSDLTKTNNLCIIYVFAALTRGITLQYVAFILPTNRRVRMAAKKRKKAAKKAGKATAGKGKRKGGRRKAAKKGGKRKAANKASKKKSS